MSNKRFSDEQEAFFRDHVHAGTRQGDVAEEYLKRWPHTGPIDESAKELARVVSAYKKRRLGTVAGWASPPRPAPTAAPSAAPTIDGAVQAAPGLSVALDPVVATATNACGEVDAPKMPSFVSDARDGERLLEVRPADVLGALQGLIKANETPLGAICRVIAEAQRLPATDELLQRANVRQRESEETIKSLEARERALTAESTHLLSDLRAANVKILALEAQIAALSSGAGGSSTDVATLVRDAVNPAIDALRDLTASLGGTSQIAQQEALAAKDLVIETQKSYIDYLSRQVGAR